MSKRKNGSQIVDIPQPAWPELAYFDGDQMRRVVPIVARDGSATYDVSKLGAKAEALVAEAVVAKLPVERRASVIVTKPVPIRARDK